MSANDLLMLLALAVVFTPLEWLLPARKHAWRWPRLQVDLLHVFGTGTAIRWGAAVTLTGLAVVARTLPIAPLQVLVRAQPDWLEFVEVLVLSDLALYAAHRMTHAVPWLWRFHEIHHSSEQMDWLAAYRVHPVDQVVTATLIAAPSVLLGFSAAPVLVYALIYRWHAVLLHSNVTIDLGPLRWIVASPRFHHWHHADQPEAYDRNFGGQLMIFDWLFGTLDLAKPGLPDRYGLTPPIPQSYLGQLAHPFRVQRALPDLPSSKEIA